MTDRDREDFGPTIEPSARRDPELSIRRGPPRPPRPLQPSYWMGLGPRAQVPAAARNVAFVLLAIAAIVAATVFLGFAAHAVWVALHLGWRLADG